MTNKNRKRINSYRASTELNCTINIGIKQRKSSIKKNSIKNSYDNLAKKKINLYMNMSQSKKRKLPVS